MSVRFYLTTAIDYVNSSPHLGTAYEKITADVIARAHRALGHEVHFVMGNDEHSQKVVTAAREQGLEPLEHCDRMEERFRAAWTALGIEADDFIRTTEERHKEAVQEMVRRAHANGDLYRAKYSGPYCVGCEAFKNEGDLVEGRCPDHTHLEIQRIEEENWFFRLSAYTDRLLEHYRAHPEFVQPAMRRNELLALLERGLEDVSVSRESQDWGVPFPFDEGSVVYVWFDALVNYIAAIGFPNDTASMERWWPAQLHLIGKDITRFHCVIWPAMLMSAGLPLPATVFGHGFVTNGMTKMSKSAGGTADPLLIAERHGAEALRYFLCAEATFGQDLEYTEERLVLRANAELANGIGNLAQRSVAMTVKTFDGHPALPPASSDLIALAHAQAKLAREAYEALDLRGAVQAAQKVIEEANGYIERTQPFRMAKDPEQHDQLRDILAELLGATLIAGRLLFPVMPVKMAELERRLTGSAPDPHHVLTHATRMGFADGHQLAKGEGLFPRLELPAEDTAP